MARWLVVWILLVAVSLGWGKSFSFDMIRSMPQSVEKDYYIWRFLMQPSTTAREAHIVIQEANAINLKLQEAYKAKTGQLPNVTPKPKPIYKGNEIDVKKTANNLKVTKEQWRIKSTKLKTIFESPNPFFEWSRQEAFVQCFVFNQCGKVKRKHFDRILSKEHFQRLTSDPAFNDTIKLIFTEGHTNLKSSLYHPLPQTHRLTAESLSAIAMDALRSGNLQVAASYFESARRKGGKQEAIDQASFWLYQITGTTGYLKRIVQAKDVNLYALMARDILHAPYPSIITPKLPKRDISGFDSHNPIHWAHIKSRIFGHGVNLVNLASSFESDETIGVYSYIKSNISKQKEHYFPMPYRDVMSRLPKERQALIYAIARQESRFIPAAVSRSFALGMMQFMPFLIEHVAKERGERIDYDDIFNPRRAIVYADHHLNYLTAHLYNPLFIAYAYNGGIGFTRRMLEKGDLFAQGRYEPYLSLERVPNDEAREYGKKVLTNYVIYLNKLGIAARVTPILKELTDPSRTDKFR
jgi:soluble lytic murein transglycosylase